MSLLEQYGLDLLHCDLCNDTGYILEKTGNGIDITVTECSCMNKRRSLRSLRESGLEELIRIYTFRQYQTPDEQTKEIRRAALRFCSADPAWFFISGKPGSGKTHICTAICRNFIAQGERVQYMRWLDEISAIKTMKSMNPPPNECIDRLEFLKRVPILYIDDFLKGKVTQTDLSLAFEILNARYNQPSKRTILSSEQSISSIIRLDEATGSRIRQRANGYIFQAPSRNWRLEP